MGTTLCMWFMISMFSICMDIAYAKNRNVLLLIGMYKTENSFTHRDAWDHARIAKQTCEYLVDLHVTLDSAHKSKILWIAKINVHPLRGDNDTRPAGTMGVNLNRSRRYY